MFQLTVFVPVENVIERTFAGRLLFFFVQFIQNPQG